MEETNVSLKLLIDTESKRMLFAEADKNFIDFLFHILALPDGTFIALLTKLGMVGCLGNIYESVENLNITYLQPNLNKETLLNPKVHTSGGGTGVPLLLPNVESSSSTSLKFYKCAGTNRSVSPFGNNPGFEARCGNCNNYVANDNRAICPLCKNVMNHELMSNEFKSDCLPLTIDDFGSVWI